MKSILVVEDDEESAGTLEEVVGHFGCRAEVLFITAEMRSRIAQEVRSRISRADAGITDGLYGEWVTVVHEFIEARKIALLISADDEHIERAVALGCLSRKKPLRVEDFARFFDEIHV